MLDKLKNLHVAEQMLLGGAVVLLLASFFPWHSVDIPFGGTVTANGWESPSTPWSVLAVLIAVASGGVVVLRRFTEVELPDQLGNFSWAQVHAAAGIAVAALLLIKWLDESSFLGFGFYLALIAGAVHLAGGIQLYRTATTPTLGHGDAPQV